MRILHILPVIATVALALGAGPVAGATGIETTTTTDSVAVVEVQMDQDTATATNPATEETEPVVLEVPETTVPPFEEVTAPPTDDTVTSEEVTDTAPDTIVEGEVADPEVPDADVYPPGEEVAPPEGTIPGDEDDPETGDTVRIIDPDSIAPRLAGDVIHLSGGVSWVAVTPSTRAPISGNSFPAPACGEEANALELQAFAPEGANFPDGRIEWSWPLGEGLCVQVPPEGPAEPRIVATPIPAPICSVDDQGQSQVVVDKIGEGYRWWSSTGQYFKPGTAIMVPGSDAQVPGLMASLELLEGWAWPEGFGGADLFRTFEAGCGEDVNPTPKPTPTNKPDPTPSGEPSATPTETPGGGNTPGEEPTGTDPGASGTTAPATTGTTTPVGGNTPDQPAQQADPVNTQAAEHPAQLPNTGANVGGQVAGAIALLAIGAGAFLAARREAAS